MLLEINFTLILFAISFLVFIYLLNLTLYKPVGKIIEGRKDLIDGEYFKAKEFMQAAGEMLENYKNKIKQARHEAHNIVQESINLAKMEKEKKVSDLVGILTKEKETAIKQIEEEKKLTMKELEKEIRVLTDLITNKILGGNKTLVGLH